MKRPNEIEHTQDSENENQGPRCKVRRLLSNEDLSKIPVVDSQCYMDVDEKERTLSKGDARPAINPYNYWKTEYPKNEDLNKVSCKLTKVPGHIYHLYRRPCGSKYVGMLSPEEWGCAIHEYLGSYLMDENQTWKRVQCNSCEDFVNNEFSNHMEC